MTKPQPLIQIIDDEDAIVLGLSHRLRNAGYRVIGCPDGKTGLETASRENPDLILLDHCLPDLDGGSLLATIKQHPALSTIPVIILSGAALRPDELIASGASAFLRKPYRKDELLGVVRSLIAEPATAVVGE